ncbi:pilus assembly protein PilP [Endozoicomonas sp. (ex Bugula neritina AB1)]|nr:pilus assembly protein PilP [Endozoicomonas sp. (ex Bugula neritina AB1)]
MSLSESLQNLKDIDPSDFDSDNIGAWPLAIRVIACVLTAVVVLVASYPLHITDLRGRYAQVKQSEEDLREQFSIKAFQAANLNAYQTQMKEMEASFGALVRQLPNDTEVPGLLEDITFTGRSAGLQIEEIKLETEKVTAFYIELPISVSVKGNYHDLGNFVSGVASLSRIVTLHDFVITPSKEKKLEMSILAKTYRYNDKGVK